MRAPVIVLAHGGGPLPLLDDPEHKNIHFSLTKRVPAILKLGTPEAPRAIIVITAHRSTENPTISNGKKHNLYYGYDGFPNQAYNLDYPAPGSPGIAKEIMNDMRAVGLTPEFDGQRGQ